MTRHLTPAALPRLEALVNAIAGVDVDLSFRRDDDGRHWVTGRATAQLQLACGRCLESFERALDVAFALCLATEAEAGELAGEVDVVTVSGDTVAVADIVEDELILALPGRLCIEEPCGFAPPFAYPAEPEEAPEQQENTTPDSPFGVLASLKQNK
ncbi:MAG: YceD family protein [Pseudomonadales bacterium]